MTSAPWVTSDSRNSFSADVGALGMLHPDAAQRVRSRPFHGNGHHCLPTGTAPCDAWSRSADPTFHRPRPAPRADPSSPFPSQSGSGAIWTRLSGSSPSPKCVATQGRRVRSSTSSSATRLRTRPSTACGFWRTAFRQSLRPNGGSWNIATCDPPSTATFPDRTGRQTPPMATATNPGSPSTPDRRRTRLGNRHIALGSPLPLRA